MMPKPGNPFLGPKPGPSIGPQPNRPPPSIPATGLLLSIDEIDFSEVLFGVNNLDDNAI